MLNMFFFFVVVVAAVCSRKWIKGCLTWRSRLLLLLLSSLLGSGSSFGRPYRKFSSSRWLRVREPREVRWSTNLVQFYSLDLRWQRCITVVWAQSPDATWLRVHECRVAKQKNDSGLSEWVSVCLSVLICRLTADFSSSTSSPEETSLPATPPTRLQPSAAVATVQLRIATGIFLDVSYKKKM